MALTYKGTFMYADKEENITDPIPITAFSVRGGAWRTINIDSTTDIGVTSELEQARQYKNITVFLPNSADYKVILQLMEFGANRTELGIVVEITKYYKGKKLEGLVILGRGKIEVPTTVANNLTMVNVRYEWTEILHDFVTAKGWFTEQM